MKFLLALFLVTTITATVVAQTTFVIKGSLPTVVNESIHLSGYSGLYTFSIGQTTTDASGHFNLSYPSDYVGTAVLKIKDSTSVLLLLNHENLSLEWINLKDFANLKITSSNENDYFNTGFAIYQETETKLAALKYLQPLYKEEPQKQVWVNTEINELSKKFDDFLNSIPNTSYAYYFLKNKKIVSDLAAFAQKNQEEINKLENDFNAIAFESDYLLHSGNMKTLFDNYFQLLGNYPDEVCNVKCNKSINIICQSLKDKPKELAECSEYLFKLFEKNSLFLEAEYLALKMLSDKQCIVDIKQEALFEQYRKMAIGKIAPNIAFQNTSSSQKQLYDLSCDYKLVIFGASWCSTCVEELPKLKDYYSNWKANKTIEIVFVSLDTNKMKYEKFIENFQWISSCDFKSWEGKAAKDYYVIGSPSMYLLNKNNEIILKPANFDDFVKFIY